MFLSQEKKTNLCVVMDVRLNCDHFAVYINIKSLCYTLETNRLYVSYTTIKIFFNHTIQQRITFMIPCKYKVKLVCED